MKYIKTYETEEDLKYDLEMIQKGMAYDEFGEYLRQLIKYDGYEQVLSELELEHKVTKPALDDIAYKLIDYLRDKYHETLSDR